MAWSGPSMEKPVWCGSAGAKDGVPTAQTVSCTTTDPSQAAPQSALLDMLPPGLSGDTEHQNQAPGNEILTGSSGPAAVIPAATQYVKFTDQKDLGRFLLQQYHIRTPQELSSCETCHR